MVYIWSRFVRVLHWLLVGAFSVAYFTNASEWYRLIHANAGYTAGCILLVRIVWGFKAKGYANFSTFPPDIKAGLRYSLRVLSGRAERHLGHNPAGSLVIYGMLIVGLLTVASGILVYNDGYLSISSDLLQELHGTLAWTWVGLVVTHVLGVIAESVLHKENLVLTMITGFKRQESSTSHHDTDNP